jgi:hypothetical protein
MEGLDLLGAVSTALSNQYINIHVKGIDADRLRAKLAGSTGSFASAGLHFVDAAPKAALDLVVPIIRAKASEYGVDADITVSNAKSQGARAFSEFFPGLLIGTVVGGSSLVIWKLISKLLKR